MRNVFSALVAGMIVSLALAGAAFAADPAAKGHVLPNPLAEKQGALREQALGMVLNGQLPAGTKVGKVAKGQYVKLAQTGEGRILAMLAEFGTDIHPSYGGPAGPLHGAMTAPDRSLDNTSIWFDSYEPQHYYDLYFDRNPAAKSVANFYAEQSSGRYSFTGGVTNWVKVPYNEGRYGSNYCGGSVCATVWYLIRDAAAIWVKNQLDSGKTMAEIQAYLKSYDVEDRYDADGDGNFDESDSYIDHFQLNHAGADEAVGGGAEGEFAIWSHRWYAFYNNIGADGPADAKLGGIQIGVAPTLGLNNPTGFWVGDYLMNPENGGVGVISHETGHDYGLPDEYDTSYSGESSSAFWTIMASGSYGGDGTNGIGNWPIHFDAWDKFQLGWLNYEVARAGEKSEHKLGPAGFNTKQAQGVFVVLPKKNVTVELGAPYAGSKFYYSGAADNLNTTMTRSVALPAGSASVSAKVRYNIEKGYDYAYLTVNGTKVSTNLSNSTVDPSGIEGTSSGWVELTANLAAYAGQTVTIGFGYSTDGGVQGQDPSVPAGFSADDISISGQSVDGAETSVAWNFAGGGFRVTSGTETAAYNHYYVVENRQYLGADDSLRTGPYNFGFLNTKGDWVEKFPYQDGVLVSYWDTSQSDNNVGEHPGQGEILPIDVHQNLVKMDDGTSARTRIQVYDATLTTNPTDGITLHRNGVAYSHPSEPAITTFDDSLSYWNPLKSDTGVKVPNTGTTIRLQSMSSAGFAQVLVAPK